MKHKREWLSILFIFLGAVTIGVALWLIDWRLGLLWIGVLMATTGACT